MESLHRWCLAAACAVGPVVVPASADLIGHTPGCPLITYDDPGNLSYDPATRRLTVQADVKALQIEHDGEWFDVEPTGNPPKRFVTICVLVDADGTLLGGIDGQPDMKIVGQVDVDGDGNADYAGVLLNAEIDAFGFMDGVPEAPARWVPSDLMTPLESREQGNDRDRGAGDVLIATDTFDFRFEPRGGMMIGFYEGRSVGAVVSSRTSNFRGRFDEPFGGGALGGVGLLKDKGACCFEDGSCEVMDRDGCMYAGGDYQGDDVPCRPGTCPQPKGACCFEDGTCDIRPEERCDIAGGSFQGVYTDCEDVDCTTIGACCLRDGRCRDNFTEYLCDKLGGAFQGSGSDCEGADCTPVGACCVGDICRDDYTEQQCINAGGTYQGDGSECRDVQCRAPKGACCLPDGSCTDDTPRDVCEAQGGEFQGNASVCNNVDCPQPTGACCSEDATCVDELTEEQCLGGGGMYQGDDSTCDDVECPEATGACCLRNGDCVDDTTAIECNNLGGEYQGDDTVCADIECPDPTGACCFDDGSCEDDVTRRACLAAGGRYQGDDTVCRDVECPRREGARCLPDGTCVERQAPRECRERGGEYQGDETACEDVECAFECRDEVTIVWDVDACCAVDGQEQDYGEFEPKVYGDCAEVTGSILYREEGDHSCTTDRRGNRGRAICVGTPHGTDEFTDDSPYAVRVEATVAGPAIVTTFRFWQRAPMEFQWTINNGCSDNPIDVEGPNNPPQKYGIRILRDGDEVFRMVDIPTTEGWSLEEFDFTDNDDFVVLGGDSATFHIELLSYDHEGEREFEGELVTAWDLDDVALTTCCPAAITACCFDDGTCAMQYPDACAEMGGTPLGRGLGCSEDPCQYVDRRLLNVVRSIPDITEVDLHRIALIEGFGFIVTTIDDNASPEAFEEALAGADVVYVNGDVDHYAIGYKLTYVPVGIVNESRLVINRLLMAGYSSGTYAPDIDVLEPTHEVMEGMPNGPVSLYREFWGTITIAPQRAPGALMLSRVTDDGEHWADAQLVIDVGGDLMNGYPAPARRVQVPWYAFEINVLNDFGERIMRNSITWATAVQGARAPDDERADVDGSGRVDQLDVIAVLSAWGACDPCAEDTNGDGVVDGVDLQFVITMMH